MAGACLLLSAKLNDTKGADLTMLLQVNLLLYINLVLFHNLSFLPCLLNPSCFDENVEIRDGICQKYLESTVSYVYSPL